MKKLFIFAFLICISFTGLAQAKDQNLRYAKERSLYTPHNTQIKVFKSFTRPKELENTQVFIDQNSLDAVFGSAKVETVPVKLHKLRLTASHGGSGYITCWYEVSGGKIRDFGFRKTCNELKKNSAAGKHVYSCLE